MPAGAHALTWFMRRASTSADTLRVRGQLSGVLRTSLFGITFASGCKFTIGNRLRGSCRRRARRARLSDPDRPGSACARGILRNLVVRQTSADSHQRSGWAAVRVAADLGVNRLRRAYLRSTRRRSTQESRFVSRHSRCAARGAVRAARHRDCVGRRRRRRCCGFRGGLLPTRRGLYTSSNDTACASGLRRRRQDRGQPRAGQEHDRRFLSTAMRDCGYQHANDLARARIACGPRRSH